MEADSIHRLSRVLTVTLPSFGNVSRTETLIGLALLLIKVLTQQLLIDSVQV